MKPHISSAPTGWATHFVRTNTCVCCFLLNANKSSHTVCCIETVASRDDFTVFLLPLPATQEWGEDQGEGSSSPRPSPPLHGGEDVWLRLRRDAVSIMRHKLAVVCGQNVIIVRHTATIMTRQQVLDLYFMDARFKLIELAGFLDRVDRAGGQADFRLDAFRKALRELDADKPERAKQVLLALSDTTTEPIEKAPGKGAVGAWNDET